MSESRAHRRNRQFRRTILLGLGPLIGLWALGTQLGMAPSIWAPAQASQQRVVAKSFDRLLQPVVSFLMLAAEHASAVRPDGKWTPRDTLALEALHTTPLGGSLWLVRNHIAADLFSRRHQRPALRC